MKSIQVDEVKNFTARLFLKDDFNDFLLNEAVIRTYNTFTIDGHIQKDFYSAEEYEVLKEKELSSWSNMRDICFSLIKGNKTPLSFKIVFQLSSEKIKELLKENGNENQYDSIEGLYLNIKYENRSIQCISGTSLRSFTMDKSVENMWDNYIDKFLLALI